VCASLKPPAGQAFMLPEDKEGLTSELVSDETGTLSGVKGESVIGETLAAIDSGRGGDHPSGASLLQVVTEDRYTAALRAGRHGGDPCGP
jgi:hypothetical protein